MGNSSRIAVISDSHNRYAPVARALDIVEKHGVNLIIHCGDIEDVSTIMQFPSHTHFVFGNCDTDKPRLRQAIAEIGATLHEPFGQLDINGVSVAFVHGDDSHLLRELENSGFDYLFHGHTHVAKDQTLGKTGKTRVINPGALHRVKIKTFILLDLASGTVESVAVE